MRQWQRFTIGGFMIGISVVALVMGVMKAHLAIGISLAFYGSCVAFFAITSPVEDRS